jgi:ubiquinone/menaquinone biosynthesis C-methylase UbiE
MKKYIIALCFANIINCMEQPLIEHKPQREPREWDAQAYDEGNTIQTKAFLTFLEKNKIETEKRTILDVGCGTGKIAAQLSEKATHVYGFDASKNMIEQAQKNFGHINNLSFEHCFAEDFTSPRLHKLAIASFCIHWFENQKQAFQHIHDSLEHNGDFFATVQTSNNPTPLELIAAQEMIEKMSISKAYKWFTDKNFIDLTACTLPSTEELTHMLEETGFTILQSEEQSFFLAMTKDEIIKMERPVVFSRPIMKYIPDMLIEPFFNDYISLYLSKLKKVSHDTYLETIITTIVHAQKK